MIAAFQRPGGLAAIAACVLLGAAATQASTITSFSASPGATNNPYSGSEAVFSSFTGDTAKISASGGGSPSFVTCPSNHDGTCSGDAADFTATITGLTSTVPISLTIDGTLTGSAAVTGTVDLSVNSIPLKPYTFSVSPGSFSTLIGSGSIPAIGAASIAGSLMLTMQPGQTLTLPSSFAFYVNTAPPGAVPEPATAGMLGIGLAAGGLCLRKLRKKQ